jgi:hypothetical protein
VGGAHVFSIALGYGHSRKLGRRSVAETAVWPMLVVLHLPVRYLPSRIERASNKFVNQLTRRHSSRSQPWKLSTCAFWVGLPGWMWRRLIFHSRAQAKK